MNRVPDRYSRKSPFKAHWRNGLMMILVILITIYLKLWRSLRSQWWEICRYYLIKIFRKFRRAWVTLCSDKYWRIKKYSISFNRRWVLKMLQNLINLNLWLIGGFKNWRLNHLSGHKLVLSRYHQVMVMQNIWKRMPDQLKI